MSTTKATALVVGAHWVDTDWNTITCGEGRGAVFPHAAERRA